MTPVDLGRFDEAAGQLVNSLRDLIAVLEEAPSLDEPEARLLDNLRLTLAEWERGS